MSAPTRYDRQVRAFGAAGQIAIGGRTVGIVGLGGLGSHLAQGLAFLGVRKFVLVDRDIVDETTLNRMVGGGPLALRHPKVEVVRAMILMIAPDAHVEIVIADLRSRPAFAALRACDVVFGAVDGDGSRLVLSEFAAAYSIVLIDAATEIVVDGDRVIDLGGRVVVAIPGEYCLSCAGELDLEAARVELESAGARQVRRHHGYGLDETEPAPSVVSLNGVVANLALMEFLALQTGFRAVQRHTTYYALRNRLTNRVSPVRADCYICRAVAGTGERADVERYGRALLTNELRRDSLRESA